MGHDTDGWIDKDRRYVWHQMAGRPAGPDAPAPLIFVEGEGAWLTDLEGRRYLDGMSGQWCVNAGYGRLELAGAAADQLARLAFYPLTRGHLPAVALGERLNELLGGDRALVFANSGSEANEVAFKLTRQYHQLCGEPSRFKIISRYRAYHGSTLGALAASGQSLRRLSYEPLPAGFVHVPPPDTLRQPPGTDLEAYGRRCADELEQTIRFELPETVAAVVMEPIITGGGVLIPPDSYLPAVAAACRRHGVLLIVDEVICGFGRTGTWFGHDPSGVRPDIVTMAKGITSAYFPLAAAAVSDEVFSAFSADDGARGRLRHMNTFGGHPAGCAVALRNIQLLEDEGLVERSAAAGAELLTRLRDALAGHPLVGEVRGRGLLVGIEVVADRATNEPAAVADCVAIMAAAQARGLIVGRNADTAAGFDNVLVLAPPLCVTDEDLDHVVGALEASFAEHAAPAGARR
jgi:taurine-pyruvate aminotransferase